MAGDITFKFPLKKYSRGFPDSHNSIVGATKENLKNLLLTKKGERVVNPDIGTNIENIYGEMFGNIDKAAMTKRLTDDIISAVDKYLPSVKINNVIIKDRYDDESIGLNQINITVNYSLQNYQGYGDSLNIRVS